MEVRDDSGVERDKSVSRGNEQNQNLFDSRGWRKRGGSQILARVRVNYGFALTGR